MFSNHFLCAKKDAMFTLSSSAWAIFNKSEAQSLEVKDVSKAKEAKSA